MKTLTTLTAVVTLVAGISIAHAQGTMGQTGSSSGGMQPRRQREMPRSALPRPRAAPLIANMQPGGLRKGRQAPEPELLAKSQEEHDRLEAVKSVA